MSRKIVLTFLTIWLMTGLVYGRKNSDIENIGNRNINGRIAWIFPNFSSIKGEIEMGRMYADQLEMEIRLIEDIVVISYINDLGQRIVKHSDAKLPFTIKVIDTNEVNAFALPGGFLYINKGLILEADNESELAGVIAHEIAHVTARHATERMTKGQLLQLASLPALFLGQGWIAYGIQTGVGLGMDLTVLGITRKNEEEADQLGTQYMWNAGLDPVGFISFFEKMEAKQKDNPGKLAGFFRTHPTPKHRISKVQTEISFLPRKNEYVLNTSRFMEIKRRLIAADINELQTEVKTEKRPTLKRKNENGKQ